MKSRISAFLLPLALVAMLAAPSLRAAVGVPDSKPSTPRIVQGYGKVPLHFEANAGQTDRQVKFLSRGNGYTLFLTVGEAVLALRQPANGGAKPEAGPAVLRLQFKGANPTPRVTALDPLPGRSNYFLGNDPKKWRSNVPHFAKVRYEQVYPGVDLVYYGNQRQLEYDLVVAPGVDPKVIRLAFEGADKLSLDAQGNLVLHTRYGEIVQRAPIVYQEMDGARHHLTGQYRLMGENVVSFEVAGYDRTRPLILDPILVYSTYLGSTALAIDVASDASGNAYVAGSTWASDFPVTPGAFQTTNANPAWGNDAFVVKLNPSGSALVYATYLGGDLLDWAFDISVDSTGAAYINGSTDSTNFPITAGVFRPTCPAQSSCRFLTKLDPTGSSLEYSTFLPGVPPFFQGGTYLIVRHDMAVDGVGNVYFAGMAEAGFPTTPDAFQPTCQLQYCAYVAKLNPNATGLVYATYLAGSVQGVMAFSSADGLAVDADGYAYVAGWTYGSPDFPITPGAFQSSCPLGWPEAFVAKVAADGKSLAYSTLFCQARIYGIAVDASGYAYLTGAPYPGFVVVNPMPESHEASEAFVAKLKPDGSGLVYSTRLGGDRASLDSYWNCIVGEPQLWGHDEAVAIAADNLGNAYVTGRACTTDFPVREPLQGSVSYHLDAFVTKLGPAGTLLFSTYLGGSCENINCNPDEGLGIAVDPMGNVYAAGDTGNVNFPTVNALQPNLVNGSVSGFLAKIAFADNTPAGAAVAIAPVASVSLEFGSVSTSGTTAVAQMPSNVIGVPPPSGFQMAEFYYDITTTATFSGSVTVCLDYTAYNDWVVEANLKLLHYEGGEWKDVTVLPIDTVNDIVCGVVTSLSPFVIARPPLPTLRPEGLLPPLAALVSGSQMPPLPDRAFKLGKTVPLKFKLFAGVTLLTENEAPPPRLLGLQRIGEPPLGLDTLDLDAGESSDSGLLFHCEGGNWVYNLKTTSLGAGTYVVTIGMPDGGTFKAGFVLK